MDDKRSKESLDETAKNAFAGYAMVTLGVACFILLLFIITIFVRLIVGAGVGAGV